MAWSQERSPSGAVVSQLIKSRVEVSGVEVDDLQRIVFIAAPAVANGSQLRVVRVTERTEIEQEELPFETKWVPDDRLELDTRQLDDPALARLVPLAAWRERVAIERDRPRRWILADDALLALARANPTSPRFNSAVSGMPSWFWLSLK